MMLIRVLIITIDFLFVKLLKGRSGENLESKKSLLRFPGADSPKIKGERKMVKLK